jgi:DMSO/TMAO reductase YedYZ molybdopterin-dependent catalytic subunit
MIGMTRRMREPISPRSTRRELLRGALGSSGLLLLGCSRSGAGPSSEPLDGGDAGEDGDAGPGCADAFAGGTLLCAVPFVGEGTAPLDTPMGVDLDGRLYTDLAKLDPQAPAVPTDRFYIRTRYSDLLSPSMPWKISVHGLVQAPVDITPADLAPLARPMGTHLMECSGNGPFAHFGMLGAADWTGVPLVDLLMQKASVSPQATRVNVSGFDMYSQPSANSTPGASWIFTFQQLTDAGAFLATAMNGAPLPDDHGFPIRLLVPGWYGCSCIKWVNEIILVDDSEPATSQMMEYASRTMQNGTPQLARDYIAATIDQAAMPVRVEKWSVGGATRYRVVGVMWGGSRPTDALSIRFNPNLPYSPVDVCPRVSTNATWSWWTYAWEPPAPGTYEMRLKVDDPSIPTRRLDTGFYARTVTITDAC